MSKETEETICLITDIPDFLFSLFFRSSRIIRVIADTPGMIRVICLMILTGMKVMIIMVILQTTAAALIEAINNTLDSACLVF